MLTWGVQVLARCLPGHRWHLRTVYCWWFVLLCWLFLHVLHVQLTTIFAMKMLRNAGNSNHWTHRVVQNHSSTLPLLKNVPVAHSKRRCMAYTSTRLLRYYMFSWSPISKHLLEVNGNLAEFRRYNIKFRSNCTWILSLDIYVYCIMLHFLFW